MTDYVDYVETRIGNRTHVRLSTGWTITHKDGKRKAHIGRDGFIETIKIVVEWNKGPRAGISATVESLAADLVQWVADLEYDMDPSTNGMNPFSRRVMEISDKIDDPAP
jgi:hypothetical protein